MNSPKHIKYWVFSIISIAALAFFLIQLEIKAKANSVSKQVKVKTVSNPLDAVVPLAQYAFIFDLKNGVSLYEKNPDTEHPIASITKVMTSLVASDILKPNDEVTITKAALAQDGDSGLIPGERWKFKDLVGWSLMVSSNDGAQAIALAAAKVLDPNATTADIFIQKMNEKAKAIGMTHSNFTNTTGLDVIDSSGNAIAPGPMSTARDVSTLFGYTLLHHPELFSATRYQEKNFTSLSSQVHHAINTDDIIDNTAGIIASKTGYTDLAGGNLAIIFDEDIGHPIIVVVLGSTQDGRFTDVAGLASSTRSYIQSR